MASTNKTAHYELSQYVGSDKPTYLTDYNTDMSTIDTGIYNAQQKADSAYTLAGTADGKADTAITNAGTAQTDASTALTRIGTMANLDTTEKTNLVGAINEINGRLDFTTFTTYDENDLTNLSDGTISEANLTLASNSDNSVIKLYGEVIIDGATQNAWVKIASTRLRPSEEITVNNLGLRIGYNQTGIGEIWSTRAIFKTNGDIEIPFIAGSIYWRSRVELMPCVIFLKNFGDTPE